MKGTSLKSTPVFINNRNRLTFLRRLIAWLEERGMERIFVIDNHSDFEPLLDFYRQLRHTLIRLPKNVGFASFWETPLYQSFWGQYFIYTDSDVLPVEECPNDFLEHFRGILERYPMIEKAGFGLKIDDLPDHYRLKGQVIQHERAFWRREVRPGIFDADIDTTFALYRPYARGGWWTKAYRTGAPYLARHLPWYVDSSNPSDEERYYALKASLDSSWYQKETLITVSQRIPAFPSDSNAYPDQNC